MYKELEVDSSGVLYIANNCRAQACIIMCICTSNANRWMSTRIHAHTCTVA